jgi:putative ABC transport system substrate-binding protein
MRRIRFVSILAFSLLAPLAARAQPPARIGFLALNLDVNPRNRDAFRQGLPDLGYVEGRNLVIEYRDAEGKPERLAAGAAELVALNVAVIVSPGTLASLAAKRATATIPIVVQTIGDPVADGLVQSLAQPGGNSLGSPAPPAWDW